MVLAALKFNLWKNKNKNWNYKLKIYDEKKYNCEFKWSFDLLLYCKKYNNETKRVPCQNDEMCEIKI